jgi:molecular chaperone Hsp33
MADQLIRATAADSGIRAVAAVTTGLTREAQQRHRLSDVATVALGRTLSAGVLLVSSMKTPKARINIRVKGDGPLKRILVDAGVDGTVRGYVGQAQVELPQAALVGTGLEAQPVWDVAAAVGRTGAIHVLRDYGYGQPYSSTVELVSGEIGEDLSHYLATSEQTPSGLMLGVHLESAQVQVAGGLLVQILPKAARDLALADLLQSRMESLRGFTQLLCQGLSLEQILQDLLGDLDLQIFPQVQPLRFHCSCSRDRALGALTLFSPTELQEMITQDGGAEATCDFCGNVYTASVADLEAMMAAAQS